MRLANLTHIKEGSRLSEAIVDPRGTVLLPQGAVLTGATIDRLHRLRVPSVMLEDDRFDDIRPEQTISAPTRRAANETLTSLFNAARNDRIKGIPSIDLTRIARMLSDDLVASRDGFVRLLDATDESEYALVDALNVAVTALKVAPHAGLQRYDLDVAVGGLLHDLGMWAPGVDYRHPLTDNARAAIRAHSERGHRLLKSTLSLSAIAKIAVLQHHEREDGSGYPAGLRSDTIHAAAKLLAVADVYCALCMNRPYRPRLLPHEAAEWLTMAAGMELDREITLTFLRWIVPYPPGTAVRLSTGEHAVVMRVNRQLPARPVLRIHSDSKGGDCNPTRDVDLTDGQCQTLFIAEVLAC